MFDCGLSTETQCLSYMRESTTGCCSEYGRCQRKEMFRQHDRLMMVAIATIGFTVRIATVLLGGRQLKAMNIDSVRQLFKRGERNLRAIRFSNFLQPKGSRAANDETVGALIDPDELQAGATPTNK